MPDQNWSYTEARDIVLSQIVVTLQDDQRFVAAWLTGSFGRGEQDAYSDLDLTVVVRDSDAHQMCQKKAMVRAGTSPERFALIEQFGPLLSVHENHTNAPPTGTFTSAIYASTGIVVDWVLVPHEHAVRQVDTRLLFDSVGVPVAASQPLPTNEARAKQISERVAFYWMMMFPTAKALLRGDAVRFQHLLDLVAHTRVDVEDVLAGRHLRYRSKSVTDLLPCNTQRLAAIRAEMDRMLALHARVREAGGIVPEDPISTLDAVLSSLNT